MKMLTIKIETENNIEAWNIITKLGFKYKVKEAIYNSKTHKFDKDNKTKDFLATASMKIEGDTAKYSKT